MNPFPIGARCASSITFVLVCLSSLALSAEESPLDAAKTGVVQALDEARVSEPASEPPAEETAAEPNSEQFETFVERQANLEVQIGLRLYAEYDDYRAITALRRYRILDGGKHAAFLAALMIGQIYHRNEKSTLAVLSFEEAVKHAEDDQMRTYAYLMALQEMCLPLAYYAACRSRLQELSQTELVDQARQLVDYQVLYTDVVLRSPYVMKKRAEMLREPLLRSKAMGLVDRDEAFEHLDLKKPWLSGVLSGVLPGAGQIYNGRWADGIISFVINAAFGAATYYSIAEAKNIPLSIVSGLFAVGFYSGNIVNAVTDAKRINAERYLTFFDNLKEDYWPRVQFQIRNNQVQFSYAFDWPGPTLESESKKAMEESEEASDEAPDAPPRAPPEQPGEDML